MDPVAMVDCERWIAQRMDTLRMRSSLLITGEKLPPKLEKRMLHFDSNERNVQGETLLIAVIRVIDDPFAQVHFY